ncbi:hypothetical protein Goarm_011118 [Gossypium armourianum]|uniref:Reverse transcriptase domain-containing protein n=1 Tax=Gossypium armourianum TaxID=34283 RepID=A0A7J9IVX7_9ROSI|nr:hypothetical protein [Gossypium armourianum]
MFHHARRQLASSPAKSNEDPLLELSWDWKPCDSSKCKMDGCLAVNTNGKSGGLVMIWKEGTKVEIINYSSNHIDSLIHLENDNPIRFMGFYGKVNPNKRHSSWNMLRSVGKSVKEKWIIGGDFNAILENVVDEFSMVDLKTNNGWFTGVNNREGTTMVKERLDHFLMSSNGVASFLFIENKVICWSSSDHDAIVLDTKGRKPRDRIRDPRLNFRYEAKKNIKDAWQKGSTDIMGKIEKANINKIIDNQGSMYEGNRLRAMRLKLGNMLDKEEKYWAQCSREFTDNEINEAFSQMDPSKASGIDGLSGNFYKENWDVVGNDIINLCHEVLRDVRNVDSLNETIIVLIPKIKEPVDMTNFCPISLCRVVYKIVAKVLANRLKETFLLCIGQNQSTFVPERMIHDNILIAHELVHYLQSAKNGPKKGFVIKLDMSKAYDQKKGVEEIVNIFTDFTCDSGQKINKDKSMIMFSPKTPLTQRQLFSSMLRMHMAENLDSYQGLPLAVSRKKSLAFTNIINRCTSTINSWSKRLISSEGKEVFIKAIIQSIPTYVFSVFLAPKGIIEDLHSKMGRLWWTNNENTHKFGDLSAKYFPEGDVFRHKHCDKSSFTWASIAKVVDALKDGFMWQVGNGNMIDIQWDHWGVEDLKSVQFDGPFLTNNEKKVKDLWDHNYRRWKKERVIEIYGNTLGGCICNLSIPHNEVKDTRTWTQNPHGFYTSKSAYSWLTLKRIDFGPHRFFFGEPSGNLKCSPRLRFSAEELVIIFCPPSITFLVSAKVSQKPVLDAITETKR